MLLESKKKVQANKNRELLVQDFSENSNEQNFFIKLFLSFLIVCNFSLLGYISLSLFNDNQVKEEKISQASTNQVELINDDQSVKILLKTDFLACEDISIELKLSTKAETQVNITYQVKSLAELKEVISGEKSKKLKNNNQNVVLSTKLPCELEVGKYFFAGTVEYQKNSKKEVINWKTENFTILATE